MAIKFSNSNMVDYVKISPYKNVDRIDDKGVQHAIEKITWHHAAGVVSVETLGSIMSRPGRNMSATYGIGHDARVGRYLDEKDRPWTSSSRDNDFKAVTIEISNSKVGGDWPVSDKVLQKAIDLTVDICKRNGIKKLTYTGDSKGNFTFHKMFSSTACPGPYIEKRANEIVAKINTLLNANTNNVTPTPNTSNTTASTTNTTSSNIIKGDLVKIAANATYYTGSSIPSWVKEEKWYVSSISGNRAVLGLNEAMNRNIQSPVNVKYLSRVNIKKAYTITLNSTDIVYATPGGKTKGNVGTNGIYTITEEQTVNGIVYGKLKSGVGWVIVNKTITQTKPTTTVSTEIKKGDKVKVLNPIIYGTSKKFVTYVSTYYVLEVKGDRVVISSDGKNVTAAIDKKNLKKI
jgi:hypothetical protein